MDALRSDSDPGAGGDLGRLDSEPLAPSGTRGAALSERRHDRSEAREWLTISDEFRNWLLQAPEHSSHRTPSV